MRIKGFTLIELLAVIAIVAVISLITVPMVMSYVESANKSAFATGAQNVFEAAKLYVSRVEEIGEVPEEGISISELKNELDHYDYISGVVLKQSDGSIIVDGLSNGEYCASGTKNDLRVVKGNCSNLDTTPPTLKVLLNKRTANSITILVSATDATSGIYGYSYSTDGINYTEISNQNIYTIDGLNKGEVVKIYVRAYNNIYDETNSSENLRISMTEKYVEFTTLEIEKPKFIVSTSASSASTVKLVDIIYPKNDNGYEYTYEIDGKEEKVTEEKVRLTITNNTIIKARIKTSTETIENELRIAGLDNEAPIANIVYNQKWERNKKIKVEVTYEQTGLPDEPYSFDGGKTWTSSNEKVYVTGENVTDKIKVRDILGNITDKLTVNGKDTEEIIIDYIDNEKPTCTLKVLKGNLGLNDWYTSNVEIGFEETVDVAKYCLNGVCEDKPQGSGIKKSNIDITKIDKDGTTTVTGTVEDNIGNTGTCSLDIKKDANKPKIPTITSSDGIASDKWHGSNYTLTFSGSTSISEVVYQYSTDSKNYTNGNSISVKDNTKNTTYYVRACSKAGICSDTVKYISKLDKSTPESPSIISSDGKTSNNWHTSNYTLTIGGNGTISGTIYQYSTDGKNYTNGNKITVSESTSSVTYYARICNAIKCSTSVTYIAKLDKTNPSITAKNSTVNLKYQGNYKLIDLFNINSYGPSGGTTTCYLIQNNKRAKTVTNNSELTLGINIIECEMVTGTGISKSAKVTIKHNYNATPTGCTSGTFNGTTCHFNSNASVCGTEQKTTTTQEYSSCATRVNTCQYGCDNVWNPDLNCGDVCVPGNKLVYGQCAACGADYNRCKTCKTCKKNDASGNYVDITSCQYCGCKSYYYAYCNKCEEFDACASTVKKCYGGYENKNCSNCKTGSPNECRGGYVNKTTTQTVAKSCDKTEYLKYSCSTTGTNTSTNATINATVTGTTCQF